MTTSPSDTAVPARPALILTADDFATLLHYPEETRLAGLHLALCAVDKGTTTLFNILHASRGSLAMDYGLMHPLPCDTPLWHWEGNNLHFTCIREISVP